MTFGLLVVRPQRAEAWYDLLGRWERMLHHPNDSPVEPSATMMGFRLLDRALLLGTVVSPFVLFWFRSKYLSLGLIPLGALMLYFGRRDFALFAHAVFWPMFSSDFCVFAGRSTSSYPWRVYCV